MVPGLENVTGQLDVFQAGDHFEALVLSGKDPFAHALPDQQLLRGNAPQRRQLIPPLDVLERLHNMHPVDWLLL